MQPGAAQCGNGLVTAYSGALGRVAAQNIRHALGVDGKLGAVQGAHILLRAAGVAAGLIQLGKMLRPNFAIVGMVPGREGTAAAAIVKGQRRGQDSVGERRLPAAEQGNIIQYKL